MPDPGELLNRSFEKASFGGYKAADVDSFMTELATALSQSGREVAELKRKLEAAENKIADFESEEESLKSTLLNVQRLADKIKKDAEEKAAVTIQNAKIKAENLIDCAQSEIEMRNDEAARIKKEVSDFKLSIMRLYKSQIELINEIPSERLEKREEPEKTADQSEPQTEIDVKKAVTPEQPSKPLPNTESAENDTPEDTTAEYPNELKKPAEQPSPTKDVVTFTTSSDTCEFVLGTHIPSAGKKRQKADGSEIKVKTTAIPQKTTAMPEKPQSTQPLTSEKADIAEKEAAAAAATVPTHQAQTGSVKLNLRYNEKTGEYEPIGAQPQDDSSQQGDDGDGLRFGADYNLRTDSFNDSDNGSGRRAPWRK